MATTPADLPTDPSVQRGEDVARQLGVDPQRGLSSAEAARRLAAEGPNELRSPPAVSVWRRWLAQFRSPLVYLLLGAAAVSAVAWVVEGTAGAPVDAVVILAVVVLNAAIGFVQETKAADAVAALRTLTAPSSTVIRDGRPQRVPTTEVVRGDILALSAGDAVGADARLLAASELYVQEASLTGESVPVAKTPATLSAPAALGDRHNMVFRGTVVPRGVGRGVVTATGMATQVGEIADLIDRTKTRASPLDREIAHLSRRLGLAVVAIAILVMSVTALLNDIATINDLVAVLLLGVSLAVAALPEGLPTILSMVLAIGVQRMAKRRAVVKQLASVEALGSVSVICTDKTGTLTRNEMTVERVLTASGEARFTGSGYQPRGQVLVGEAELTGGPLLAELRAVCTAGAVANNAALLEHDGDWRIEGDPTEGALLVAAAKIESTAGVITRYTRRAELPFSSERKMMSVCAEDTTGRLMLFSKGAPDVLIQRCSRIRRGEEVVELDSAERDRMLGVVAEWATHALRTLAVAYRPLPDQDSEQVTDEAERGLVLLGVVGMIDPPREEAAAAVAEARRAGVRTLMITGDHPGTAGRIATDLGIATASGDTQIGSNPDDLDDAALAREVEDVSVYARVAPHHKQRIVDALQANGRVVAMTGDGVNDAPALKGADIGVAMGSGTEVAKQAADMILADDNFATIVAAVRQGRVVFDNITKFLRYLLSSNIGETFTVFFGVVLSGVLGLREATGAGEVVLPLLAVQILWINLVTDSLPALAMGVDPPVEDVMARGPRDMDERMLGRRMWGEILYIGLVMAAATLLTMDIFLPGGIIAGEDSLIVARTAGFTTLVLAQLFNALNSRSSATSAFHRLFHGRWLWAALGGAVVLQIAVVHVPVLQTAFGTAPLRWEHWLVAAGLAATVLWFDEARKLILRQRRLNSPRRG